MAETTNTDRAAGVQCAECGSAMALGGHRLRYCPPCKILVRRRNARARALAVRQFKTHKRDCRRCGATFSTTGPYNHYCADCVLAADASGRSRYQFLSRRAVTIPAVRTCDGCGAGFAPTWSVQSFCGPNCKTKAYRSTLSGNINSRMRCAIRRSLNGGKRGRNWEALVGYTVADLMAHLNRQMPRGASWNDLHIDHIVPLASFTFASAEDPEFRAAWALTNLRPLGATDNIRKGAKRLHLI